MGSVWGSVLGWDTLGYTTFCGGVHGKKPWDTQDTQKIFWGYPLTKTWGGGGGWIKNPKNWHSLINIEFLASILLEGKDGAFALWRVLS